MATPDVRRSTPHILTMAGEVTATHAAREIPKMVQQRAKLQKASQKEMAKGATPPIPGTLKIRMLKGFY